MNTSGGARPQDRRWVRTLLLALSLLPLGGCFRRPLLTLSPDVPPVLLAPVGAPAVADGRARFREIYCAVQADHGASLPDDRPCEEALVRLGGEASPTGRPVSLGRPGRPLRVLVVPGLLAECFRSWAGAFAEGLAHLETHGYRTGVIQVSALGGTAHNARMIRDALTASPPGPDERLVLVGHSKGATDILEALVSYPELLPRVAAVVSVAGAIGGSPLAGLARRPLLRVIAKLGPDACEAGDGAAGESLQRAARLAFLARHRLPDTVRYFSLGGIVGPEDTSRLLRSSHRRLSEVDPRNDGQLVASDMVIPGATLLGFARADHWAIALGFARTGPPWLRCLVDRNAFPREVLLEAIVRAVEEAL